jgi:putative nucleotidyltransferase with HDIG domain
MINDCGYGYRAIAEEVTRDQVLSARVLRLCNSAFIGLRNRSDSIDRAMLMLGEKQILRVALAVVLERFFSGNGRGYSLCKGGLYYHALETAVTTEMLATVSGKVPPDTAYTAGLLHDIGKVVLDQYMAPMFPYFYRRTQSEAVALTVVEREVFGLDHAEVGSRLAESWALPRNLMDAISHHHRPDQGAGEPALTHLVYLADLITSCFMPGLELERLDTNGLSLRLRQAGIHPEQFCGIIDRIPLELVQAPLSGPLHANDRKRRLSRLYDNGQHRALRRKISQRERWPGG